MDILYIATFLVAFFSSILSGMAGGGGGFVMAPYWLAIGLTPAQGAAVGSFMATGMAMSSVAVIRKAENFPKDKRLLFTMSGAALIAALAGAIILPKVDAQTFKYVLAFITLVSIPLLFTKLNVKTPGTHTRLGIGLAICFLVAGSITMSSAFSILFASTLMIFFSMSVFEMTAVRRLAGLMQSGVMFAILAANGHFEWEIAATGFVGGSAGSYIGTKYAIKKGESFAKYTLAFMALASALVMLV